MWLPNCANAASWPLMRHVPVSRRGAAARSPARAGGMSRRSLVSRRGTGEERHANAIGFDGRDIEELRVVRIRQLDVRDGGERAASRHGLDARIAEVEVSFAWLRKPTEVMRVRAASSMMATAAMSCGGATQSESGLPSIRFSRETSR